MRNEMHCPDLAVRTSCIARTGILLLLLACLSGCMSIFEGVDERQPESAGEFLSKDFQRETVFSNANGPRLVGPRRGEDGYVDTSAVNSTDRAARERRNAPYDGRASFGGDPTVLGGDERGWDSRGDGGAGFPGASGAPGGRQFAAGERVTLRFDDEPLPSVIRQVLGGVLRVNYVIPPGLTGNVTFRTERPIPVDQVLLVLRDILARYNLAIRRINDVYQIGTPDELELLEANSEASRLDDPTTRIIKLQRGNAVEFARVLSALVPAGTSVSAIESSNSLVVRGRSADFGSVMGLLDTLVATGMTDQRIAIVPLNEAPPEQVAAQVLAAYSAPGLPAVSIVPLDNRQAVLVSTASVRTMDEVKRLVRELDTDLTERAELRIIQLTHLKAEEMADQLVKVFGGEAPSTEAAQTAQTTSNILAAARDRANAGVDASAEGAVAADGAEGSEAAEGQSAQDGASLLVPGSEALSITANARSNSLLIRSSYKQFKRIKDVVAALDIPEGQVVIEATILEVDINDRLKLGVQFFLEGAGISARSSELLGAVDPGGAGFTGVFSRAVGNVQVEVVLEALQSVTNVKIVSSPYLTVANNQTARLSVGDQIPFTKASQTSNSGGSVTVTQEVETRDTGVILEVTPQIRPDNSVSLLISQEVSAARAVATGADKGVNPVISQRSINSQIVVDSGATALLGGLIQERASLVENGVPVLRKIPVVGNLFRQRDGTTQRSELVVLITPRVARRSGQLEQLTEQLRWQSSIRPHTSPKP
ncbi:type II secretion system secretin GspD [Aquibium microcysteis]|uniref:type II secretion system secretin GspD n=1 Tax=Aquibium microcysteis TaxID=675281 RepID=UPI00165D1AA1|nr:type II secretion system secretin GspD [Aquibium microcysteis]